MRQRNVVFNQSGPGMIFFTRVTTESLPDNVLLDIFDCYRTSPDIPYQGWHVLVHVCRRWRFIAFASPLRLDLRLECNANTPVEKTLDVWPRAFPILIKESRSRLPLSGANIIAAIKHHDRVSEIDLYVTTTLLRRLYKVMKKPYPVLTHIHLEFDKKLAPVAPDTFLGRSAPSLKYLNLIRIPFPTLPKFLPICHDLVTVHLEEVPNSGYISPEAMATALSGLTKLESFHIGFESPASFPDPRNRPPSSLTRVVKRVVLPSLSHLEFRGASEYFEDLVARLDAPATIIVDTRFFNQLDFDISQFLQFIGRTQIPRSFEEAKLYFVNRYAYINVGPRDPTGVKESSTGLSMTILCHALDWQVAGVAQICSRISPFLSNVERLLISNGYGDYANETFSTDYVDIPQWLELFHAFSALQHMRIPPRLGEIIGSVLQELTEERTMDALPMLHHLYLPSSSISVRQAIEPFISSRQHFNHPVAVHFTEMD